MTTPNDTTDPTTTDATPLRWALVLAPRQPGSAGAELELAARWLPDLMLAARLTGGWGDTYIATPLRETPDPEAWPTACPLDVLAHVLEHRAPWWADVSGLVMVYPGAGDVLPARGVSIGRLGDNVRRVVGWQPDPPGTPAVATLVRLTTTDDELPDAMAQAAGVGVRLAGAWADLDGFEGFSGWSRAALGELQHLAGLLRPKGFG